MRIRITVVTPSGDRRDVDVDGAPGATAADLARALGAGRLSVSGRSVAGAARVGSPPLLHGAVVHLDPTAPVSAPSAWELWAVAGPDAGLRYPLPVGRVVVGRARGAGVGLADPRVSRRHAMLTVDAVGVSVQDLGGPNGTRVCGSALGSAPRPLCEGEVLEVGDTRLELRRSPRGMRGVRADGEGHLLLTSASTTPARPRPTVAFPEPEPVASRSRFPVLALLVPVVLAGVVALVTRSPTMLLFGLTGPLLSLTTWLGERRRRHREAVVARTGRGASAWVDAQATLDAAVAADRAALERAHPPPSAVLATAERWTGQLWSGPADIRVGVGRRPAGVTLTGATAPGVPSHQVAPITVDLEGVGVLGVHGPRAPATRIVVDLLCRLGVSRSPADVEMHVVVDSVARARDWAWAAYLPHVCGLHLGRLPDLAAEIAGREAPYSVRAPPGRRLLVVVLDGFAALRHLPGTEELVMDRREGVVVVALDANADQLPGGCGAVLEVGSGGAWWWTPGGTEGPGRATRVELDQTSPGWSWRVARALAPLHDPRVRGSTDWPDEVRLLDVLPAGCLDDLAARWSSASAASGATRAVIGVTVDGPFMVDLRLDGPHVLVAGTTGAGKSELLQTLVSSLALANRPDQMSFLLVDYKGGAALRDCDGLPHVVGVITDLDGQLAARALVSLKAELRRRERLLQAAGVGGLEEYLALPPGPHRTSFPRLVIVIDEFRVLAEELPDFVPGLVRLAAVGRSLGIHLVLATQRPAGVVSADIRANVSLRIALRVRDRAESVDVLDAPDAARIGAHTPGRAYLSGASTPLTLFQAARVTSAAAKPVPITVTHVQPWWERDNGPPQPSPAPAGRRDLDRIIAATRRTAAALDLTPPASPWLPPLADAVDAGALAPPMGAVAVGLEDDPSHQRQREWCWAPAEGGLGLAGGGRSGRTTAALTVAIGLARTFPPSALHLYALGPAELSVLCGMPHTAAVASLDDPEHVGLVLDRLRTVVGSEARTVVLVDGWEQLAALAHGTVAAELRTVLESGSGRGMRLVATGGRAVLAGQLVPLFAKRLVLPVGDPVELALAGIPAKAVPAHQPPGRGLDVRTHREVQVAAFADLAAAIHEIASAWPPGTADDGLPRPVHRLPDRVLLSELTGAGVGWPVGPREGDLETVGFDPGRGERRLLIVGGPRFGRTTALATLAYGLAAAGHPLAVLGRDLVDVVARSDDAARQLRLTMDGRDDGDLDLLVAARREHPDLALVVDDAERLAGLPIEPVLAEIERRVDEDRGLVVAATTVAGAEGRGGSFLTGLARAHTGVVLSPTAGTALLGAVLPSISRHPGRGFLVANGEVTRVQVATLRP